MDYNNQDFKKNEKYDKYDGNNIDSSHTTIDDDSSSQNDFLAKV